MRRRHSRVAFDARGVIVSGEFPLLALMDSNKACRDAKWPSGGRQSSGKVAIVVALVLVMAFRGAQRSSGARSSGARGSFLGLHNQVCLHNQDGPVSLVGANEGRVLDGAE